MQKWREEQERHQQEDEELRRQEQKREREQQAQEREANLKTNQICPRCKQVRRDGKLWENGHLYFSRFCENCTNATPHSIYKLTCPLLGVVRYVGITVSSLNKRLTQHMNKNSGTERKRYWIEDLRAKELKPLIELIDEAPNEQQAKHAEIRYIFHSIQQGCPLVNTEAMDAQLVLDIQNSTMNFLEASEEELHSLYRRFSLAESVERARQHEYQLVRYQKARWFNRYKSVYIAYNAPQGFFGRDVDTLKREWALRYDHVCTSDELPTGRQARKALLQTVTEALFYTEGDRIRNDLLAHDCRFLLERNIYIASQYYHTEEYRTEHGVLVSVGTIDKGYPYGKAIIHLLSYTVSPEKSLL
jgi:hypothetical protein